MPEVYYLDKFIGFRSVSWISERWGCFGKYDKNDDECTIFCRIQLTCKKHNKIENHARRK